MARSVKDILAGTYFGRLFKADKLLFLIIFLFFTLSLLSNLIRLQTSPFFIWDMYSQRADTAGTYRLLEIRYDGDQVVNLRHSWNEPEKTILTVPLQHYLAIRENNGIDPFGTYLEMHWLKKHPGYAGISGQLYNTRKELDEFPAWYKRWLSAQLGLPLNGICVLGRQLAFEKDGRLREISSDTVLVIR